MKRIQIFILLIMAMVALISLGGAFFYGISVINSAPPTVDPALAAELARTSLTTPTPTTTPTPIPTSTVTPISTETPVPTPTSTRVVNNTATLTPSITPTRTPIPTRTPVPTSTPFGSGGGSSSGGGGGSSSGSGGSSGGSVIGPTPTPRPTSRYELDVASGPISYETDNHFLVVLAKVTAGGVPLPGYKMVGSHTPTGSTWESQPTCDHYCKASGPGGIEDEDGNVIESFSIQEGNLFFDAPFYDTGVWTLVVLDPQGRQASEYFQLELDGDPDEREWFWMHFVR